ncbi:hypothetical protein SAMD00019534_125080, partial [Acytostelium subglobosum LB1]|uniref:hypothetical protein n=1 Tax=Acytostelium subglobosum LB1 TaxID=1410327 RepID=UPI000644FC14
MIRQYQSLHILLLLLLFMFTIQVQSISTDIEELIKEGDNFFKQSKFDSSLEKYTLAIDRIGDASESDVSSLTGLLFKRAGIYQAKHRYTMALSDVNRALQYNPDNIHAKNKKAKILTSLGRFEQAKEEYGIILKAKPNNAEAIKQMDIISKVSQRLTTVRSLMEKQQYAEAIPHINQVLEAASEIKELKLMRAEASFFTGDYRKTIEDTSSVLKSEGSNTEALYWRSRAFFSIGEKEAAIKYLKDALNFDPDNEKAKNQLKNINKFDQSSTKANEYFSQNRFDESLREADTALEIESNNPLYTSPLLLLKCKALLKLRKAQESVKACTKLIEMEENADAFYNRGEAFMYLDEHDRALADFQKANQLRPNDGAIHDGIRRAQQKQKMASRKDYYKIMGIDKSASAADIKKHYKSLARKHHPDKADNQSEEAKQKFVDIVEAYSVLSDPEKRDKYDRGEDVDGQQQHQQQHGQGFPFGFGFPGGQTFSFNFGHQ